MELIIYPHSTNLLLFFKSVFKLVVLQFTQISGMEIEEELSTIPWLMTTYNISKSIFKSYRLKKYITNRIFYLSPLNAEF